MVVKTAVYQTNDCGKRSAITIIRGGQSLNYVDVKIAKVGSRVNGTVVELEFGDGHKVTFFYRDEVAMHFENMSTAPG